MTNAPNLAPSHKAFVPFVSVENMMRLVNANGLSTMLIRIADAIEEDFLRWDEFDKTPRVASHS
ncbi:MAG: ornithine cyclodeaminase, partial [Octadecabacter sp.]